jgi:signal transduction histidine kinase
LILALTYFLTGRLGVLWAIPPGIATAIWFPSGLALYGLLRFGYGLWPGILVGSFLVNIFTVGDIHSWGSAFRSIGVVCMIAGGSTLQSLCGAYFINTMIPRFQMWEEVPAFLRFFGICVLICLIAPTIGTTILSLSGLSPWHSFWRSIVTWWLGDLMGILLILPLPLLFQKGGKSKWGVPRWIEFIIFVILLVVIPWLVFGVGSYWGEKKFPLTFLLLPSLIWGAFRFGRQGVLLAIWVVSPIALWGTVSGFGPFASFPHAEALFLLQFFFGIFIITGLTLAVALKEQRMTEEELRRAIEEAQQISLRKMEFTSILSHDLGTPLTVMKDNVDMVLTGVEGPLTPRQGETLEIVMSNVDRLARLTKNLLNFEKLESGKMEMVFHSHDLRHAVEEVSQFIQVSARKKGVKLGLEIPGHPIWATCDEDKIKEVLLNLVDNSLKYSSSGGQVWIRLKQNEEETVLLEVEDKGIGIKKEEQEKVFEIFRRGSPPGLARVGGAGVGLAVCKWIVDLHHGEITVDSDPGKGTCFRLELPCKPPKKS